MTISLEVVDFTKCEKCIHYGTPDHLYPCSTCLQYTARKDTNTPLHFKEKEKEMFNPDPLNHFDEKMTPPKNRDYILEEAKRIINGDRQGTYGNAEDSFKTIAELWTAYLTNLPDEKSKAISSQDVANMMILLKVARNTSGVYKDDNWIDICGYAALGGEM